MITNEKPLFGVAGFPPNFFESSFRKKRENIFAWLKDLGLDWVELQNTYGVKMKKEQALLYRKLAEEYGIGISLHAPYYITLASADGDVVARSKERIVQCFELAETIGATRIIFHPGHYPKDRVNARQSAVEAIIHALNSLKNQCPPGVHIYPETAGKRVQIGSLEEIIEICKHVSYAYPCLDTAHIHGFEGGTLTTASSISRVLSYTQEALGKDGIANAHFHMYPVEIDKNGEKRHRAFEDRIDSQQLSFFGSGETASDRYHPLAENFIAALLTRHLTPVVICEARDTQDTGAQRMKQLYFSERGSL